MRTLIPSLQPSAPTVEHLQQHLSAQNLLTELFAPSSAHEHDRPSAGRSVCQMAVLQSSLTQASLCQSVRRPDPWLCAAQGHHRGRLHLLVLPIGPEKPGGARGGGGVQGARGGSSAGSVAAALRLSADLAARRVGGCRQCGGGSTNSHVPRQWKHQQPCAMTAVKYEGKRCRPKYNAWQGSKRSSHCAALSEPVTRSMQ